MPYRVSVGYTSQEGILKGSDYQRVTAGFNVSPSLFDKHLNINANAKYSYAKTNPGGQDAIGAATTMDPTRPVKSSDEKFKNWGGYWQWTKNVTEYDPTFPYGRNDDAPSNPVEKIENYGFDKSAHVLLGNLEADYKIHVVNILTTLVTQPIVSIMETMVRTQKKSIICWLQHTLSTQKTSIRQTTLTSCLVMSITI